MAQNPPWCVIDGRPRWNERRLAELATRKSDSAALLDGFARYGGHVLWFIGGRFRVAVVESRRALLAVDRIASLPIYFASPHMGSVVFASSINGLLAHPAVPPALSAQAIAEYFHFQVLHGGQTIFHGIHKLQPASRLLLDGARLDIGPYWHVACVTEALLLPRGVRVAGGVARRSLGRGAP